MKNGVVTTTNAATQTTICSSDTIPDDSVGQFLATYIGRDTGTGDVASSSVSGSFKRVAGTLSVVASVNLATFAAESDASLATCTATIDASSNTIRQRVNGVALTDIEWFGTLQLWIN